MLTANTKASSGNSSLDEEAFGGALHHNLPPVYVDTHQDIDEKLAEAEQLFVQLRRMQAQRLRISFDTDEKAE